MVFCTCFLPASACSSSPLSLAPCGCDTEPPGNIAVGEGACNVACDRCATLGTAAERLPALRELVCFESGLDDVEVWVAGLQDAEQRGELALVTAGGEPL